VVLESAPVVVPITFTANVHELFTGIVPPASDRLPEAATAVTVPAPHVPASPFGVAINSPAGSVSVKATPVSETVFATGFVIVKLRAVEPFNGMLAAVNAFVIVGAAAMLRFAVAVFPAPPLVAVTGAVVFVKLPTAVPVTLMEKVQEAFAASVAPEREAVAEAATAVIVPPPQVPVSPFGVATTNPGGKVSVKATPVSAAEFETGLVIVKLSEVEPFSGMLVTPNDFAIEGGASTKRLAEAVVPVPPSADATAPVVLFLVPAAVPVTFTEKLQAALAASAAPDRLTRPAAAGAVIVPPPQVPISPFGVETTRPTGRVSVNPTALNPFPAFGFARLKVSEVLPLSATLGAPNDFAMVAGAAMVKAALEVFPVPALEELMLTLLL